MDQCRICDEPATQTLGSYRFCDGHMERALHQRGSLWRADLLSIMLLIAFVVVVYALDQALSPSLDDLALTVVGIVMALVPAGIWLAFFYRRDRLEPEPRAMVLGVFVLGALVAGAFGIPLTDRLLGSSGWLTEAEMPIHLAGLILIPGIIQMAVVYLTVRLSVYHSREFDEWTDGILYGTAAGIGYATWLNVDLVVSSGGVDLGLGVVRVTLAALVLASLGGLVGYFLGHDRLEVRPIWYVPLGVALAAILDGVYWYLRSSFAGGFAGSPSLWVGLGLAAVLAIAVTWFLANAVRRELARASAAPPVRKEGAAS